ncbi:hypothetical protein BO99DRAFT_55026 [Aspergillus violaceofuscus CBS 115571]|uniref:Uncharacterized protein n=1 Tax=Aspergillus violaceofuscus (strain CBS 115571) TaxID=1450538 RepID=A0A2V5GWK4_ASPV1|nr:hypothetical protein BO99DRAFT_55026 [Aspergillus violaceofuscus CBS 115571]
MGYYDINFFSSLAFLFSDYPDVFLQLSFAIKFSFLAWEGNSVIPCFYLLSILILSTDNCSVISLHQ